MTSKQDFTDEEWKRIRRAPFVAGFAISIADPGGPIALAEETMASHNWPGCVPYAFTHPPCSRRSPAITPDWEHSSPSRYPTSEPRGEDIEEPSIRSIRQKRPSRRD
jgi:hypothetical protein